MNRSEVLDEGDPTVSELTRRFEALASTDWSRAVHHSIARDNLMGVHRHAVEGVTAIEEFLLDARASEDIQLWRYLERLRSVYAEAAEQAQDLLLDRII